MRAKTVGKIEFNLKLSLPEIIALRRILGEINEDKERELGIASTSEMFRTIKRVMDNPVTA